MQETWDMVPSLGQEDPLEEEMATHSRILAWKILWTEETDGLQSMGHKESDMTEQLSMNAHLWGSLLFLFWLISVFQVRDLF